MSERDEISARLTVLETVVKQLITHLAIRDDDPAGWVHTRKTLAIRAIDQQESPLEARLRGATDAFFGQPEELARHYRG